MHLCFFEDSTVKNLHPLTYLNPAFELYCGCLPARERLALAFPGKTISYIVREFLAEYASECYPDASINKIPVSNTWFINSRTLVDNSLLETISNHNGKESTFFNGDDIVAAYGKKETIAKLASSITSSGLSTNHFESFPVQQIQSKLIRYPWDMIYANAEQIENDFIALSKRTKKKIAGKIYPGAHLLNKKNILIGKNSSVKPGVVLDAEHGPIVIGEGVTIMSNAVIEGPAFIGDFSTIKIGAKIYPGTTIGKHCKIGGEVTRSIFQPYSNKAHDGFVGDSNIGRWVNLGADTNTSNLKNTYGNVTVYINGKPVDSKQQFIGLTIGDHSKSGINVMFNTGTVVGVSCNIVGAGLPGKYIPSFSWGSSEQMSEYEIEKSVAVAQRVMARRDILLSKAYKAMMNAVFTMTARERKEWLKK